MAQHNPQLSGSIQLDLIFGVVAFNPAVTQVRTPYLEGVHRWIRSVRKHTVESQTELVLFTGRGKGSIERDESAAKWIRELNVHVVEDDFYDDYSRVEHGDSKRFVWCVMRNRWFVISKFLAPRILRYRYVLMSDTRDVLVQGPPFEWSASPFGTASRSSRLLDGAVVFSGEGSGKVRTLRQSKKGLPRTLKCARGITATERRAMLDTEPLNAGVTLGTATAFLNFSWAMTRIIKQTTTVGCLEIKDCTDQGLYNLLVYLYWVQELPHTRKVVLPLEKAPSYTLGHKQPCCHVDSAGRVLNDAGEAPPIVHQFAKGLAGRQLPRTRFWREIEP